MKFYSIKTEIEILPWHAKPKELTVLNIPLTMYLGNFLKQKINEVPDLPSISENQNQTVVAFNDNLFFTNKLFQDFISACIAERKCTQLAISLEDDFLSEQMNCAAITKCQDNIILDRKNNIALFPLFYSPTGKIENPEPLMISTKSERETFASFHKGYFPKYDEGKFQVPFTDRSIISIENWIHYSLANIFANIHHLIYLRNTYAKGVGLIKGLYHLIRAKAQGFKDVMEINPFTTIGQNTYIGKDVTILASTIGNNVSIESGTIIQYSNIADNTTIGHGCSIEFSVIGKNCAINKNVLLTGSTIMDGSTIGQRAAFTIGSVVGMNTVVGTLTGFGDAQIVGEGAVKEIRTLHKGRAEETGCFLLGGAIGHNARIGNLLFILPGRMIGNNVKVPSLQPVIRNIGEDVQVIKR